MTDRRHPLARRTSALAGLALAGLLAGTAAFAAAPAETQAQTSAAPSPDDAVRTVTAETGVLRRLPSVGRPSKLAGEIDRIAWPVFLTPAEAAARPRLRLTHVAAVSVMPEASHLAVFVDDRRVASFPIATNGSPKTVEVTLPEGSLHAGWNALRVEAEQRHRVECTAASTYELWTEIDRARSGLVFADGFQPERRSLADIADLSPDETGRVRIRLVTAQDPDPARLARATRFAQALALAGGFLDPVVSIVRTPAKGPGADILIGAKARDGVAGLEGVAPDVVALLDDADPTRLTLALPDDADALDRLIADLEETASRPDGSEAGRRARAALGGVAVSGGETVSLADLGARSTEFGGRLFRTSVDVRLPGDFYAADYAKAAVRLAGGYAPGLDRDSRLTLRVNGRQVAGAPLSARSGETFADRRVEIPLSAFRPGHNRIEIEASVPAADDRACDPTAQIDAPKRFLFVDTGSIAFPSFARSVRLPDLHATGAGAFAALDEKLRPTVWMPRPDRLAMSAFATLTTRMAVTAGRVQVPEIAFRNPPADAPSAWVIGAFADLPATIAGVVGIEPVAIRDAWSKRPATDRVSSLGDPVAARAEMLRLAALDDDVDMIVTGSVQFRPATGGKSGDLVDQWRRSMENPWSPAAFGRTLEGHVARAFGPLFADAPAAAPFSPRPTTGILVAQALSAGGGVWTLTTAATAAALADGAEAVTAAGRWSEMSGDVAAWDKVDEKLETGSAKPRAHFMTAGWSPANLRLVAAGWVGEHPIVFALYVLAATVLLGFATARMLPHLGGRS